MSWSISFCSSDRFFSFKAATAASTSAMSHEAPSCRLSTLIDTPPLSANAIKRDFRSVSDCSA